MSDEDYDFLFEAQEELIRRCMDERGFRYVPNRLEDFDLDEDEAAGPLGIRLHPLQGRGQAEREGYGGPSLFVWDTQGHTDDSDSAEGVSPFYDPNREHLEQLSKADQQAWDDALIGTGDEIAEVESEQLERSVAEGRVSPEEAIGLWMNTDGCVGVAEAAIYGDLGQFMRLSFLVGTVFYNEVWDRIQAASSVVDVQDAWRRCMHQHGHDLGDPWDVLDVVQQVYDSEPLEVAKARESEIALQDASCATKTGLFEVIDSELARIDAEVMAEHEGEILGYQEMMARAVETAKELLASP